MTRGSKKNEFIDFPFTKEGYSQKTKTKEKQSGKILRKQHISMLPFTVKTKIFKTKKCCCYKFVTIFILYLIQQFRHGMARRILINLRVDTKLLLLVDTAGPQISRL